MANTSKHEFIDQQGLMARVGKAVTYLNDYATQNQSTFGAHPYAGPDTKFFQLTQDAANIIKMPNTEAAITQAEKVRGELHSFFDLNPDFKPDQSIENAQDMLGRAIPSYLKQAQEAGITNINSPATNSLSSHLKQFLGESHFTGMFGGDHDLVKPTKEQAENAFRAFSAFDSATAQDSKLTPAQKLATIYDAMDAEREMRKAVPGDAGHSYEIDIHDAFGDAIRTQRNAVFKSDPELANLTPEEVRARAAFDDSQHRGGRGTPDPQGGSQHPSYGHDHLPAPPLNLPGVKPSASQQI